ncbi:MAG: hypothetical protein Q4G68_02280 [Planctomycetia bacterium]|nr:hypothetical protein [Planctomycetia bacterium]
MVTSSVEFTDTIDQNKIILAVSGTKTIATLACEEIVNGSWSIDSQSGTDLSLSGNNLIIDCTSQTARYETATLRISNANGDYSTIDIKLCIVPSDAKFGWWKIDTPVASAGYTANHINSIKRNTNSCIAKSATACYLFCAATGTKKPISGFNVFLSEDSDGTNAIIASRTTGGEMDVFTIAAFANDAGYVIFSDASSNTVNSTYNVIYPVMIPGPDAVACECEVIFETSYWAHTHLISDLTAFFSPTRGTTIGLWNTIYTFDGTTTGWIWARVPEDGVLAYTPEGSEAVYTLDDFVDGFDKVTNHDSLALQLWVQNHYEGSMYSPVYTGPSEDQGGVKTPPVCFISDNLEVPPPGKYDYYLFLQQGETSSRLVGHVQVTLPQTLTQLAAPTSATATATDTSLTINFESDANAESYLLRYATSNPPTGDGAAYLSGTALTGMTANTTYYYQLKAVGDGSSTLDSDWSEAFTCATLEKLLPPVVTCTATRVSITPTFDSVTGAGGYRVRYGTSTPLTGDGETCTSGTALTGLTAGTSWFLQFLSEGNHTTTADSDWSTTIELATPANAVPSIALAGTNNNVVTFRLITGQTTDYNLGSIVVTDSDDPDLTPVITEQTDNTDPPAAVTYFAVANGTLTAADDIPAGTYNVTLAATDSLNATETASVQVVVKSPLTPLTTFHALVTATGAVHCDFSRGNQFSNNAQIAWQKTATDPDQGTPTWQTLATN